MQDLIDRLINVEEQRLPNALISCIAVRNTLKSFFFLTFHFWCCFYCACLNILEAYKSLATPWENQRCTIKSKRFFFKNQYCNDLCWYQKRGSKLQLEDFNEIRICRKLMTWMGCSRLHCRGRINVQTGQGFIKNLTDVWITLLTLTQPVTLYSFCNWMRRSVVFTHGGQG